MKTLYKERHLSVEQKLISVKLIPLLPRDLGSLQVTDKAKLPLLTDDIKFMIELH